MAQKQTGKNWDEVVNRDSDEDLPPAESQSQEQPQERVEALEATEGTTSELSEELDVAQTEAKRNYEMFLRSQAELDNVKRRAEIDLQNAHKFGIKRIVEDLVPVLDSMEQALEIETDEANAAMKQMHEGLLLTYNMLLNTAKKNGIEQLDPKGEKFNPENHEAMSMTEAQGVEPNCVITVFQKGYLLNGRLLRPARVVVAK